MTVTNNMNGDYLLSNANTDSSQKWDSSYAKFEVRYRTTFLYHRSCCRMLNTSMPTPLRSTVNTARSTGR